uniref:ODAD1 central coiled coil region domain-containing protein n=1 Tax=Zooxanthella nutricula TaxID=1333877 RepID=A0A7S2JZK6_9DINO
MEQELAQKKREMANIIEQANAAYEARDQAQAQMASLKQQADREHLEFEREWKELGKLISNDKNMKDYMKTMVKASRDKGSPAETREMTHRKTVRNAWDPSLSVDPEKVASFEEAFERIQAATGIDNLEELVVSFVAAEDTNFTLFNYNNELTANIEKLEEQIAHYKEELVQLSGTGGKKEEVDKVKILETLEEKWNNVDKQATNYELKYQESHQALTHIRTGIESLFKRAGCATKDLPSGTGTGISEGNMMQYLALVEGRTNELLKMYDAVREGDDFEATRARPGNAAASLQVNKLPSTVEDHSDASEDDDEEDSRPFTVEELKAKSKNKVKKLAQAKGKAKGRT